MTTPSQVSACGWCGGRGWKFVRARRSLENVDTVSEGSVTRQRETCLGCAGADRDSA
jgi:hypothetical protein